MLGFEITLLVALLVLSAFFSSSETAFFYLDPIELHRLSQQHPQRAKQIRDIRETPTRLLSTILIGNTFVNIAVPVISLSIAGRVLDEGAEPAAILGSLMLLVIFGEIGPKRLAVAHAERLALLYAMPLNMIIRVFGPLRMIVEALTSKLAHRFEPRGRHLSYDEYQSLLEMSSEDGVLDEEERFMVKGIIRLEDLHASDVMTPRVDMITVDLDDPDLNLEERVINCGVRQLPLYRGRLNNTIGFLDVRAWLLDPERNIKAATTKVEYVPEAAPLHRLLAKFISEKRRAAIVVDEYGGTAGIITRGDILEEIVGDIDDEQGRHALHFEEVDADTWILDGRVPIETIEDRTGIDLDESGFEDRIAGFISAKLERLPRLGDVVENDVYYLKVQGMRRNRITLVELRRKAS
ncbi:MAG: putative hemolysin [Kiritimatiellia bacterium]|jgi:putative hemolysin